MAIDYVKRSQEITKKIQEAERLGQPIVNLVKEHIEILQAHHDDFVKQADAANIHNLERGNFEIQLLSRIKAWANKIGLPVEKYDNEIRKIRVYFLGEENLNNFIPKK